MIKKTIALLLLLLTVVFCGGCFYGTDSTDVSDSPADDVSKETAADSKRIGREQYSEIYRKALINSPASSDPNNHFTFEDINGIAPNNNVVSVSDGEKNYYLIFYDIGDGKLVCIFDEKDGLNSPDVFMGMVFCTKKLSANSLSEAKKLKEVYEISGVTDSEDFVMFYDSAELSGIFDSPSDESDMSDGYRTLHITDEGFYLIRYEDNMINSVADDSTDTFFNMECEIVSVEKCELPEQERIYGAICEMIY